MKALLLILSILASLPLFGQYQIEGYIFESGNRGYLSDATVTVSNLDATEYYGQTTSDESGTYSFNLSQTGELLISVERPPFIEYEERISVPSNQSETFYLKHEITRKPGYIFEITLAEKDPDPDAYKEALHGALIEVYNNTKKREELVIEGLQRPDFKVDFIKGNHYTILVRKEGFLSKRMEAFVDVEGCILCFEGIGQVTPGVSDNLSDSNNMGVLLANVEMDRYFEGKVIGLNDIYYDLNQSSITKKAAEELNKVAGFIKDNPDIVIELGSHTDSQGKSSYNALLSDKRAKAAVQYLVDFKGVDKDRIRAKGYGESEPTNKCIDGVKCTEVEYAVNRRTELKVLQVQGQSQFQSLRSMKTEEHMDEILEDLSAEGQIRIPDGAEGQVSEQLRTLEKENADAEKYNSNHAPVVVKADSKSQESVKVEEEQKQAEIAKQELLRKERELKQAELASQELIRVEEEQKQAELASQELIRKQEAQKQEELENQEAIRIEEAQRIAEIEEQKRRDVLEQERIIQAKEEERIAHVEQEKKKAMAQRAEQVKMLSEQEVTGATTSEKLVAVSSNENVIVETGEIASPTEIVKEDASAVRDWIAHQAVPVDANVYTDVEISDDHQLSSDRYSADYTGYKIVLLFSRYQLPADHPLFERFEDLDVYTTADGNKLYMVESYNSKNQASNRIQKRYQSSFPNAYVVGFESGVITD